jgi:hypothetical protein
MTSKKNSTRDTAHHRIDWLKPIEAVLGRRLVIAGEAAE